MKKAKLFPSMIWNEFWFFFSFATMNVFRCSIRSSMWRVSATRGQLTSATNIKGIVVEKKHHSSLSWGSRSTTSNSKHWVGPLKSIEKQRKERLLHQLGLSADKKQLWAWSATWLAHMYDKCKKVKKSSEQTLGSRPRSKAEKMENGEDGGKVQTGLKATRVAKLHMLQHRALPKIQHRHLAADGRTDVLW